MFIYNQEFFYYILYKNCIKIATTTTKLYPVKSNIYTQIEQIRQQINLILGYNGTLSNKVREEYRLRGCMECFF